MNTIWVLTWDNESGDSGVEGYWIVKPTPDMLDAYMRRTFPDDFEDGEAYIYWVLEPLQGQSMSTPPLEETEPDENGEYHGHPF